MRPLKFYTEHFEGEAKNVGNAVIGNKTIPVFEFGVKDYESIINNALRKTKDERQEAEQEFFVVAQKLLDEIEKEKSLYLAFIYSEIERYCFSKVISFDDDNPVKGFLQVCVIDTFRYGDYWLTWIESPALADKRAKDEAFRTAFEKWALTKFLQLVFGDRFLKSPLPRFGSEKELTGYGFENGVFDVGTLGAYYIWSKTALLSTNLLDFDDDGSYFAFADLRELTDEDLKRLYEVLLRKRPPRDFYKNIFELTDEEENII